ncbi:MAG: glycoside hydrolase family 3 N-terminal domain-containing protein [Bryobacteraceae bacterium]|nr:glycoside hydrolase family 3 N-terminal domain-containing protein [Bryobacteraceae bacterium]
MLARSWWALICFFLSLSLPGAAQTGRTAAAKPTAAAASPATGPVQRLVRGLSLRQKVAQLVMVPFYGEAPNSRSRAGREFQKLVRQTGVGGLILVNRIQGGIKRAEPFAMASFLNRMQRVARVPLIVGGDFERGASMRVAETVKYPHAMAYGAAGELDATKRLGAATAREARAVGVHWIFAPSADVNNNPDNPIINIRSFGEDPKQVAEHVAAFITGVHSVSPHRALATVKHFPGHGDTAVDSHMNLPRLDFPRERLDAVELVPFKAAVAAGVDAVMTAHIAVPALSGEGSPATLSGPALSGVLRKDLGFQGLIVTDAMDMQGLSKQVPPGEAAVRAIEAGVDVLLMPPKPEEAIDAIVRAVKSRRLTAQRIDESLRRVLLAKSRLGLFRDRRVDVEDISETLDSEEAAADAQAVARRAVTLLKNEGGVLPLAKPESACYYVLTESRYGTQGRIAEEEFLRRAPKDRVFHLDPADRAVELREAAEKMQNCSAGVVVAFVTTGANRGDVLLPGEFPSMVERVVSSGKPVAIVAMGSPYTLRAYPKAQAAVATFTTVESSEAAAVQALFGEIPFQGRSPVTIPGVSRLGDGIQLRGPSR